MNILKRLLGKLRPAPEPSPDARADSVAVVPVADNDGRTSLPAIEPGITITKPAKPRRIREDRKRHGSKFVDFVVGGLEIAAGILITIGTLGGGAALGALLIAGGVGFIVTGIGTLISGNNQPGLAWASRNPIEQRSVFPDNGGLNVTCHRRGQ